MRTTIEEPASGTWERTVEPHGPGDDDLLPWIPGDGFPDGNDPLRLGAGPHDLDSQDDEDPSSSWEDPSRSDDR